MRIPWQSSCAVDNRTMPVDVDSISGWLRRKGRLHLALVKTEPVMH